MDFANFLAELNIRLGDSDDFTFTPEEKTSILTEAINDENVVKTVWDTTLTFDSQTYQYAIPSGLTAISDIGISPSNSTSDEPQTISGSYWSVVGSNIQFTNGTNGIITTGYTLYVRGRYKYTINDTITETNLQEYVLKAAQYRALGQLSNKKLLRFLKNDTSVAEIVALRRELERDLAGYKRRLPRAFEAA